MEDNICQLIEENDILEAVVYDDELDVIKLQTILWAEAWSFGYEIEDAREFVFEGIKFVKWLRAN